jgi:membrane protein DedA with SNARE-associated domain
MEAVALRYSFHFLKDWSTTVTLAGYFLGIIFPQIKDYLHYLIFTVIFVSLIPALIELYLKYKIKKALKKLDS